MKSLNPHVKLCVKEEIKEKDVKENDVIIISD